MGLVMGKGGETLKLIERAHQVKITLADSNPSERERRATLQGSDRDMAEAKEVIKQIIQTGAFPMRLLTGGQSDAGITLQVPAQKGILFRCTQITVGLIIGKGGETIQALQSRSGAKITIATDGDRNSQMKTISLNGTQAAMDKARDLIDEILNIQDRRVWLF